MVVTFKRLFCFTCNKARAHEVVHELARCVVCDYVREESDHIPNDYDEPLRFQIERFLVG